MRCVWPSSKPRTKDCAMICGTCSQPWHPLSGCCCRIIGGSTAEDLSDAGPKVQLLTPASRAHIAHLSLRQPSQG